MSIRDDQDRLAATGRVRMLVLEPGTAVAGQVVSRDRGGGDGP